MCDYSRKPVKWQVGNFSNKFYRNGVRYICLHKEERLQNVKISLNIMVELIKKK